MTPFKQQVACTFMHDRAGLKCGRCGYARGHTESDCAQRDESDDAKHLEGGKNTKE